MKTMLVKVFLAKLNERQSAELPISELYARKCIIDVEFQSIQGMLSSLVGEWFRSESNETDNGCYLTVYLLGDRDLTSFKDYFERFQVTSDIDPILSFSEIDADQYIKIAAEDLSTEEISAIQALIRKEGYTSVVLQGTRILEKGASGFWQDVLIAFTVDVAKDVLIELVTKIKELLKNKHVEEVSSFDLKSNIKQQLLTEYNLEPTDLYLSNYHTFENGRTSLVYKSSFHTYRVDIENGEVVSIRVN